SDSFIKKESLMPSDVHHRDYLRAKYSARTYYVLMKTLQTTLVCESSDVAEFRLHTIRHYYQYGIKSTLNAFKIKRSTFYGWKREYERSRKNAGSLIPCSTKPNHVRRMQTDWRIIEFIKQMRKEYGNIGKNMIKPFLDAYTQKLSIPAISSTAIGKVIKRRKLTFEKRVYIQRKFKFKKLRTRKSPRVNKPGFIQMDSIVVYINKERHLFMSIMDIYTKYALVEYVESLNTISARKVFLQFQRINPTPINIIQTDNGSEFLGEFHKEMERQNITHQFIYPRMCKINGFIERFNRTVQEEFILRNDEIYYDIPSFKDKLTKYLSWYNYRRPHSSLRYVSPVTFI
ncbi:hypothetical protein CO083_04455, partial [Candidatus Roizmanbacteria bacterium CG_4_9_14_0_8_um_filter_34_12]